MVPRSVASNCCVSGVKGDGVRAGGGKRARCANYAEQAVEQGNRNLAERCGFRGQQWHVNFNRHFDYCMDVRRLERQRQLRVRTRKLKQCDQQQQARRRVRCGHLARLAVQQSRTNINNRCGFSGRYWNTSLNRQIEMCQDELSARGRRSLYNLSKFEKREDRLRRCMMRGGGVRDNACDDFSKAAINHYARSVRYRCGLSSDVWNDNYDLQYDWCRSARPPERSQRLAVMNNQIKRCKKRRGWKKIFKF